MKNVKYNNNEKLLFWNILYFIPLKEWFSESVFITGIIYTGSNSKIRTQNMSIRLGEKKREREEKIPNT